MLGFDFPGGWTLLVEGNDSESGGCKLLGQVQAGSRTVCDAKILGLRVAQVTNSIEKRKRANGVCAEDTCRCWTVLVLQVAELSREWQGDIVVVQWDMKKAFDHVDHRAAFKSMKLQGVDLFSMA